jgi:hypothetical protein
MTGAGAATISGGSCASTITTGSGTGIFKCVSGHDGGSEKVLNFNAIYDSIAFSGYDSALPIASETVKNRADIITLTDGTSIDFVGVDHKVA